METYWRPTCLIGDLLETYMPHRRPFLNEECRSPTLLRRVLSVFRLQEVSDRTLVRLKKYCFNSFLAQDGV